MTVDHYLLNGTVQHGEASAICGDRVRLDPVPPAGTPACDRCLTALEQVERAMLYAVERAITPYAAARALNLSPFVTVEVVGLADPFVRDRVTGREATVYTPPEDRL